MVAVALRIMREEGLERVTMRRLASELDTGPASLYVYVANMAELHGALLDELLAELELTRETDAGTARETDAGTARDAGAGTARDAGAGTARDAGAGTARAALTDLLADYIGLLIRYPSLARSVLSLWPTGPHYLRLVDSLLGLLAAAGVPARQAAWGVDLLLQHATATAAEHGTRDESVEADEQGYDLATAIQEAAAADHPHIARVRSDLLSGTGGQRMRWQLAALIDGIATTPTPE